MKLPMLLTVFTLISRLLYGTDIYLYSPDGKPISGFELQDFSVEWKHAKHLSPQGVGKGYPVSHYRDPTSSTGWAYDFHKTPREVRAAYRKANSITEPGRMTSVFVHAEWCGPCKRMKRDGIIKDLLDLGDVEEHDIDESNPFDDSNVPVLRLFDADNHQIQTYTGYTTIKTIREALNK